MLASSSAGATTTLYTDDRSDFVEALRDALEADLPIEHLFSRKRSFRQGLKKQRRREYEKNRRKMEAQNTARLSAQGRSAGGE